MMIPLSKPDINGEDVKVVVEVLKSGRLSMGPYTEKFEKAVSEYVNAKYGVAVSSGTAGLHLVLKAMGVERGDYMIVPSFTFVASANVALYEGAIPLFVDVEEETLNASKDSLEDLLIRIKKGKVKILNEVVDPSRVKYFMGVDIFGHPLDWDEILEVTNEWRLEVLEDSCEALGAEYKGKRVGKFGVAGVFAFYPNKQITTGEGGVVITDDERIAKLVRSMRNQGRGEENEWLLHVRLGYNYRIDEMSAALGYSQMLRIDEILKKEEGGGKLQRTAKGLRMGQNSFRQRVRYEDELVRLRNQVIRRCEQGQGDEIHGGKRSTGEKLFSASASATFLQRNLRLW